jgi:hypothetical protein
MAFPSLPDFRDLLGPHFRWDRSVRNPDPFGRVGSLVLRVLWITAIWGMVLYLRHLTLAAAPAPRPTLREAILGSWEPESRAWSIEFTADRRFHIHANGALWAAGFYSFTTNSDVGIRIVERRVPLEASRHEKGPGDFDWYFTVEVTPDDLLVAQYRLAGPWPGGVAIKGGWFPPNEPLFLRRVQPRP